MDKNIAIQPDLTIKQTLKKLDKFAEKVLIVVDCNNKLIGSITDGDIRRALLSGKKLDDAITDIYYRNPIFIYEHDYTIDAAKKLLLDKKIELIPIVDNNLLVKDFITWSQAFSAAKHDIIPHKPISIPVVIMAGGKGSRLEPFTKVLPKPLIPINDKTILEYIIEQFSHFGISQFYLTLNYKGDMIKAYFNSIETQYNLEFIVESDFMGTAGSLKLLENCIDSTFIVSNCDILAKANYSNVYEYHKIHGATMTIISSIQHYKIPYGVIEYGYNGKIEKIIEKPEHSITINTGVYLLERECLEYIPENKFFHMTDLIEKLIDDNKTVHAYPINENDYIDIGQWGEYKSVVEKLTF